MFTKKNFKFGDKVWIRRIDPNNLVEYKGVVVGIAVQHIIDFYIVEISPDQMTEPTTWTHWSIPETCLDERA